MGLGKKSIAGNPRLLILLNRFVIGGQAVDTLPLAYFLQAEFEILLLYGEKEKDEVEPTFLLHKYQGVKLKKITYLRRSINPLTDLIAFIHLVSAIINFKPHIVHTHGAKSGFLGRLAAWLCNVPVIVHTFHGHFFHSYFSAGVSRLITLIERAIGKITTAAIALSDTQKKELVEEFKIFPARKVSTILLGLPDDVTANHPSLREAFRNRYGLTDKDVAIGIVGRIVPIKNHTFFIKVIGSILTSPANRRAAFFIIGDGDLRKQLEDKLVEERIDFNKQGITEKSRVVFTSWLTDIDEVMSGLDIIALTSLNEGTPLSIIEAQFFKRPVVSTDVGGVRDTLEDGRTGFLIAKNDIESFCVKLSLLVNDDQLRVRMGEAGSQLAIERFSKQKEVERTKDFYFSLLQKKGCVV